MIFSPTKLADAYVVELEKIEDERGFFARAFCSKEFEELNLNASLVQCNLSYNIHRGTLRGMHFQKKPYAEVKFVRCVAGAIYDVIIDLRPDSKTYKQWIGVELSSENRTTLYVPEGFAHGYQSLADHSEVFYQVSQYYTPAADAGVRWDDPIFGINWPATEKRIISEKDRNWPDYRPDDSGLINA